MAEEKKVEEVKEETPTPKKKEKKHRAKKVMGEFGKFISRGNVVDMSVGVIIGGAFTAVVTALTTCILNPCINAIISLCTGGSGLESAYTILIRYDDPNTGLIDLTKSIYINWGALISAIINFFLIAIILFAIVKTINSIREGKKKFISKEMEAYYKKHPEKRPPVEPEPEKEPTEVELLKDIKELLAAQASKDSKEKSKKEGK